MSSYLITDWGSNIAANLHFTMPLSSLIFPENFEPLLLLSVKWWPVKHFAIFIKIWFCFSQYSSTSQIFGFLIYSGNGQMSKFRLSKYFPTLEFSISSVIPWHLFIFCYIVSRNCHNIYKLGKKECTHVYRNVGLWFIC